MHFLNFQADGLSTQLVQFLFKWVTQYMAEQMTNQMQNERYPSGLGELEKQWNLQDISNESDPCSPLQRSREKKTTVTHKTCGNKLMATSTKWEHGRCGMWIKENASAKHVRKIVNIILAIMIIALYTLLHLITIFCSFHAMEMD